MQNHEKLECETKRNLSIWYCQSCQSVHFRVAEMLLTFSPEEFIDFASVIDEIYGQAYLEVFKQRAQKDFVELGLVS